MVFLVQPVIAYVDGQQEINIPVTKSLQDVTASDDEASCSCVKGEFAKLASRLFTLPKQRKRSKSKDENPSSREVQLRRMEHTLKRPQTCLKIRELYIAQTKSFSRKELLAATDNFAAENIIGHNVICQVYRGKLPGGNIVTVVTSQSEQIISEFETRIKVSNMAIHRNLFPLYGYCQTGKTRFLVFPVVSNENLQSHLERGSLNWTTRKKVALGVARGLAHMHEYCHTKIIHRHIKPSTILLNEDLEPVIVDIFSKPMGNAYFDSCLREHQKPTGKRSTYDCEDEVITRVFSHCPDSLGYTAPEYIATKTCSEKTDVFAFGITILQLVSGWSRPHLLELVTENPMLIGWVRKFAMERRLDMLADPKLQGSYVVEEMSQMIKVGLLCTSDCPKKRPRMSEVIRMLEGVVTVPHLETICQELNCTDCNGSWLLE